MIYTSDPTAEVAANPPSIVAYERIRDSTSSHLESTSKIRQDQAFEIGRNNVLEYWHPACHFSDRLVCRCRRR